MRKSASRQLLSFAGLLFTILFFFPAESETKESKPPSTNKKKEEVSETAGPAQNAISGAGQIAQEPPMTENPFSDYQPKLSPDTAIDYRPSLAPQLAKLPPARLKYLADLISVLKKYQKMAKEKPGLWEEGNMLLGAAPKQYRPSDEELLANEAGQRIEQVVKGAKPEELRRSLEKQKIDARQIQYKMFLFDHADVMGSGRFFYASDPAIKTIQLDGGAETVSP